MSPFAIILMSLCVITVSDANIITFGDNAALMKSCQTEVTKIAPIAGAYGVVVHPNVFCQAAGLYLKKIESLVNTVIANLHNFKMAPLISKIKSHFIGLVTSRSGGGRMINLAKMCPDELQNVLNKMGPITKVLGIEIKPKIVCPVIFKILHLPAEIPREVLEKGFEDFIVGAENFSFLELVKNVVTEILSHFKTPSNPFAPWGHFPAHRPSNPFLNIPNLNIPNLHIPTNVFNPFMG